MTDRTSSLLKFLRLLRAEPSWVCRHPARTIVTRKPALGRQSSRGFFFAWSFNAMADDRLIIFDTTLRDGEQSPGASMNLAEKLEVAHALTDLGVDVIEAGFPIASPGDFEAVQAIAREVARPDHLRPGPLQRRRHRPRRRGRSRDAARPRIHVFLATSAIHREFKLKMAKEEIVRRAVEGVKRAKGYVRRRRVLARGRRPHRAGLPRRGRRARHRGRRHHGQHPRHGRLRRARASTPPPSPT